MAFSTRSSWQERMLGYGTLAMASAVAAALLTTQVTGTEVMQAHTVTRPSIPSHIVTNQPYGKPALTRALTQGGLQAAGQAPPVARSPSHMVQPAPLSPSSSPTGTLWVTAALASLMANGVAAAFLAGRRGRSATSLAMAAATTEPAYNTPEDSADDNWAETAPVDDFSKDNLDSADSLKSESELEIEELKSKLAETEKKYLYALAEIETVRRRGRQQVEDAQKFGIEKFALAMLEVADNMSRGLSWVSKDVANGPSGEESPNPDLKALYGGMRSTEKIMLSILERQGIQKYEPLGEVYDPSMARAIAQVPSETQDPGTVLEVTSAGYTLNGRVLRAADVVVVQDLS